MKILALHVRILGHLAWWPILGPRHDDRELVATSRPHYHVDWRYVPDRLYRIIRRESNSGVQGVVLLADDSAPVVREFALRREAPDAQLFECQHIAPWLPKLEASFAGCKLKSLTCPHKGIPLDGVKPDSNGIVTCPGHGLRWHLATGELVAR